MSHESNVQMNGPAQIFTYKQNLGTIRTELSSGCGRHHSRSPTHLPGLSIVLGFNLQHRMGRWSQEGSGGVPAERDGGRLEAQDVTHLEFMRRLRRPRLCSLGVPSCGAWSTRGRGNPQGSDSLVLMYSLSSPSPSSLTTRPRTSGGGQEAQR